jgi:putative DNA methylase
MGNNETPYKKKLIEVGLPLEAINEASYRERAVPRRGHPSTLHLWWARRPLATARAVLFGQLVDDPSAHPEIFDTVEKQEIERNRLHEMIKKLVQWENTNDEELLCQARDEILRSNGGLIPEILDPFAGGGTIPLEAQRLGLKANASDLNPIPVLINRALIEIPALFANRKPVNQYAEKKLDWKKAEGLAEDVRKYGQWINNEAFNKIGHLYPKATDSKVNARTVIAWIWARTVTSPNPANPVETPLARSWWLSKKKGHEAYIVPSCTDGCVSYSVTKGKSGPKKEEDGTRRGRGAISLFDGTVITSEYIKEQGVAGKLGARMMAIVTEGDRERVYLPSDAEQLLAASVEKPDGVPEQELAHDPRNLWTPPYGLTRFSDLFTNRQLVALSTLCDLIYEVRKRIIADATSAGWELGDNLENGGSEANAYADAICLYLGFTISKLTNFCSSLVSWHSGIEGIRDTFARQSIPMVWDYCEVNIFSNSVGNYLSQVSIVANAIAAAPAGIVGTVKQENAANRSYESVIVSTDPPYYDNIEYSNLSDYFYVWLRQALSSLKLRELGTLLTPKSEELVANQYRHNGKMGAQSYFIDGFNQVFSSIRIHANRHIPITVYYAYKQQDTDEYGNSSTGWYTLLEGLIKSGWTITATLPVRSERGGRMISVGTNALASSIVLACRPRPEKAEATTRRLFVQALKQELPPALEAMMKGSIAPVDLAQAAIGPGISVFSRHSRVREADGSDMSVRDALLLINSTLDEVLNAQETDFDPDTRFAVKWYRSYGWTKRESGIADQLSRSTDTSIAQLERGGIFETHGGKARLIAPAELSGEWNPEEDTKVSVWEAVVRLSAVMQHDGEERVAALLPKVQTRVNLDAVKELGFLLYHEAEKKGDTEDAILFNSLVGSWGDISAAAPNAARIADNRDGQQQLEFE